MLDVIELLRAHDQLRVITEPIDPYLQMAELTRQEFKKRPNKALLFEQVKGSSFKAISNVFGDMDRAKLIFNKTYDLTQLAISLRADPQALWHEWRKNGLKNIWRLPYAAYTMLPRRISPEHAPVLAHKIHIADLPQIVSWPMDGGAFITLPQVFSKEPREDSIFKSNLGMYRIQISGNEYIPNQEIGLHYQIHRGIGIHHTKAIALGEPLRVSIFVGGPPAHTLAAVMPLPEGFSELHFAGLLSGQRFRYTEVDGYIISADADFCIIGEVALHQTKREGPFGDHLGYYSLAHEFPLLNVKAVYHRQGAVWPFTVVGRPPQEDSIFGEMIHDLTAPMVGKELPGIKALHAVDAAGVHPLLLALGSERYVPYGERSPKEILTEAHAILGFGQCSLAKYLMIAAYEDNPELDIHDVSAFFTHILERIDLTRDLHFITKTTMDTLDYSGSGLNSGSKVMITVCGSQKRSLSRSAPVPKEFPFVVVGNGILALTWEPFTHYDQERVDEALSSFDSNWQEHWPLIILCDDADFLSQDFTNFLWVTFTRSNPSHDIYGVKSHVRFKHWGCNGSLVIDARLKPHHAPPLEPSSLQ